MNQSRLNKRAYTGLSCGINEVNITQVWMHAYVCVCVCVCVFEGGMSLLVCNGHMIIHSHETMEELVSYYGTIR